MLCTFVFEFPEFKFHLFSLQPSHPNTTIVAVDQSEARVVILGCEGFGKKIWNLKSGNWTNNKKKHLIQKIKIQSSGLEPLN